MKRIGTLGLSLLLAAGVLGVLSAAGPAGATLPGANSKIAYANGGIWVAGPGGEDPIRLTSSIMDRDPSWSPDGTRIAFTRLNGCQNPECVFGDVWVMDAVGTDGRLVTDGFNPSWSPDDERLAYESCATSGFYPCVNDKRNVSLVNPNGTGMVELTAGMRSACNANTTSRGVEPAWSPDGRRILHRVTPGNALTAVTVTGEATSVVPSGATPDWQALPNTRPTISAPKPAPGSRARDATPLISAVVNDDETDLQKTDVKLYVDGRAKTFSYSASTDRLTHKSTKLKPGARTVKIVARDAQGLTAKRSWSFKVAR